MIRKGGYQLILTFFKNTEEGKKRLQTEHPIEKPEGDNSISRDEYLRQFDELQNGSEFQESMDAYDK